MQGTPARFGRFSAKWREHFMKNRDRAFSEWPTIRTERVEAHQRIAGLSGQVDALECLTACTRS
jgi:hypothetical protein